MKWYFGKGLAKVIWSEGGEGVGEFDFAKLYIKV